MMGALVVGALAFAVGAQGGPRVTDDGAARTKQRTKSETARLVTGSAENLNVVAGSGAGTMEMKLTPVASHPGGPYPTGGAYGAGDISGQVLTVTGGGFPSFWNVQMRNWAPSGQRLRSWQGRIDAMSYMSGTGTPLTMNTTTVGANNAACVIAMGEGGAKASGGFCNAGWVNTTRSDGVFKDQADPSGCGLGAWDVGLASPVGPLFFATTNPGDPAIGDICAQVDNGLLYYGGTLSMSVPGGAKGTYTLTFVDEETFAADDTQPVALPIGILDEVAGVLVIQTGSCCYDLGTESCTNDLTLAECNDLPTSNTHVFRPGEACGLRPCGCTEASHCFESPTDDKCTTDTCVNFVCNRSNKTGWDTATQCCDAGSGAICTPVDPNVCANQACSILPNRGVCETTNVPAGDPCKGEGDENPCTMHDECDGNGAANSCAGTDVNGAALTCVDDADCQAQTGLTAPTCVSGVCDCSLQPDLTIEITPSGKTTDNCFDGDAKVTATVHVAAATAAVNGGQFLISYDPSCLDYNSAAGVDPYTDVVFGPIVNEAAGTVFVVVGTGFGNGDGPAGNADMLSLSFSKKGDCNSCSICFASNNPQNTYLADSTGQRITVTPICSDSILANSDIDISTPPTTKVNADCDQPTAVVTWGRPTASDSCGSATVTCSAEHQSGLDLSGLAYTGGELPIGLTNFCCTAASSYVCSDGWTKCWTVDVNDEVSLDVEIGLSPTSQSKPADDLTRCIKFTLYPNTIQEPFRFETDITFGGIFDFVGKSKDKIKVPSAGQWDCITAWDQRHTLRSCYLFGAGDCAGGRLHASFKGDPAFGGNWLIGGNLDGWKKNVDGSSPSLFVIDVLDYATFLSQWGADYGSGDTPCGTASGANADINGDGVVDLEDYAFINNNFLTSAKLCCGVQGLPASDQPAQIVPITDISVRELREHGMGDLAVGDLNGDGRLNVEDMNLFMQGERPVVKDTRGSRKTSGTR
ncbi:MAG: hypothetical protein AABZ12_07570 [Planctomycetota bacterium]